MKRILHIIDMQALKRCWNCCLSGLSSSVFETCLPQLLAQSFSILEQSLPVLQKAAEIAAAQSVEVSEYKGKLQAALVDEGKLQEELDHAQLDIAAKVSQTLYETTV